MIVKTLVIPAFLASLPIFHGMASQELKQELFSNFYQATLTHVEKTMCANFVRDRKVDYSFREQYSEKKAKLDALLGAAAEIATCNLLESQLPDFKIYPIGEKSYAPDITLDDGTYIHVKSTNAITANNHELSWVFTNSPNERLIHAPLENDYLALWVVDPATLECTLIAYMPASEAVFGLTKVERYHDSKRVIYAKSIPVKYLACNLTHPQQKQKVQYESAVS